MPRRNQPGVFSILLTGSAGCGKTSLMRRFMENTFLENYNPTQFMNTHPYTTEIDGKKLKLRIVDTDGDRKYEGYSINYYAEMNATVVIYDVSDQSSLEDVKEIIARIKRYCRNEDKLCTILVGNKSDKEREINKADADNFAKNENITHIETSVKTDYNVKEMFEIIIRRLIEINHKESQSNKKEAGEDTSKEDKESSKEHVPITSKNNSGCSCTLS